ncbi:hypothetical protein AW736_12565 [Termitidicoccus mucosus]|uniref:GtrA-like protein domain-containing protein n=1 Tax=Termitidicoccus mucosus TaxID=1184151 RepID=A0A178II12_9BACT|nr:hypothetical protein AW736_12565 [Opitutaceae bacterium TSB47]
MTGMVAACPPSLFILSYGIVYLVNILVVKSFLSLGLNSYQAGFIALLPVAFLSYFLQSRLVFIKPKSCRRATSDSPPFNHTT